MEPVLSNWVRGNAALKPQFTNSAEMSYSKTFENNNTILASVSLSINDIFRIRKYDQYSESDFFIQNSHRLNDAPMLKLNFAYRFGKIDMSLFKRKNMKNETEGTQGAMQGIQ